MGRNVDLDDLADSADVAAMLGLSSPRAVSTYRSRYEQFPAPIWQSRAGRCVLWLRADIETWKAERDTARRREPG